jgi:glycosyltransferase involved in cell wall biosynthesis
MKNNMINIIIPVHNGGEYFNECLTSLIPIKEYIDNLILCINNSDTQKNDIEIAKIFLDSNSLNNKAILIIQKKEYSAVVHGKSFLKKIIDKNIDGNYMFLCHDDIILPDFKVFLENDFKKNEPGNAVNPTRSYYKTSFCDSNFELSFYPFRSLHTGISISEFVSRDIDRYYLTNLSGVIVDKYALREYYRLFKHLLYGYRAEYILLTNKRVNKILNTEFPVIGIREHPKQEGKQKHPKEQFHDDQFYFNYHYYITDDVLLRGKLSTTVIEYKCKTFHSLYSFIKTNIICLFYSGNLVAFVRNLNKAIILSLLYFCKRCKRKTILAMKGK